MSSGPGQHPIPSLVLPVARALLASIVALSFFATIAPLVSASAGLMACCVGKAGHESGSCSSGLLHAGNKGQPQPEPKLVKRQEPEPKASHSSKTVETKAGGHCSHNSAPSAVETTSDSRNQKDQKVQSEPEPTSAKSEEPSSARIHTLSRPCSAECAACSISYTRRPRPREQSTLSFVARPRPHLALSVPASDSPQIKILSTKGLRLRPRGPPSRLS